MLFCVIPEQIVFCNQGQVAAHVTELTLHYYTKILNPLLKMRTGKIKKCYFNLKYV